MDLQEPTVAEATQPTEGKCTRDPSYGEKAVGLSFNPSGDTSVQKVKELYAQIIDIMDDFKKVDASNMTGEHKRLASVAIREAQTAQMRATKALLRRD